MAEVAVPPLALASLSAAGDSASPDADAAKGAEIVVDAEADALANAGSMLSDESKKQLEEDADGDGIPDVAKSLHFMVDADGDGVNDGLHSDKLGTFAPEKGLTNDRPFFKNQSNSAYSLWWSGGKYFIGLTQDVGRNRGWLRVQSTAAIPPSAGWQCYSSASNQLC